jgi:hypothetical protein
MRVVVADLDRERVQEVETELRSRGTEAVGMSTDVADAEQMHRPADRTWPLGVPEFWSPNDQVSLSPGPAADLTARSSRPAEVRSETSAFTLRATRERRARQHAIGRV